LVLAVLILSSGNNQAGGKKFKSKIS